MSDWAFLHAAAAPTTAVEIAAHRISAATVTSRRGRAVVSAHASEPVPDGVLTPSLTGANIKDRRTLLGVLSRVLDKVGKPKRLGLVVPDPIAKVSLLKLQQVPSSAQDLDQIVRWQVRKTAPFPIEKEAQVSFAPAGKSAEGQEFLVSVARRDVVAEYEGLCTELGSHPGIVDLATFNVVNAVLASAQRPDGDWLLVNAGMDWASIVILRGADPILFRSRSADADGTLADLVHQTAMYYEDRLSGTGFQRVLLAGAASGGRQDGEPTPVAQALTDRLGARVDSVDVRSAITLDDRLTLSPAMLEALTPLAGFLVRDQRSAA